MKQFRWKDVGDGRIGPGMYECYENGQLVAKVIGKFEEWHVEILYKVLPGSSAPSWVKSRIVIVSQGDKKWVGDGDIFRVVEHRISSGSWPPSVKDCTFDDMQVEIENKAARERGDALSQYFDSESSDWF